ncbi:ribosomal protein S18-alanine N-acetyltransferase [Marinicella meishanensis]|uniref:ribosomal protein S18-alanine N-acetyltransferase n=1 Tax=Marinicella meishanensis TaxID=2873263 RepID=UPI001CBB8C08|nr:ribosomal protein S18-alanine N-acetyltransferase [Marinicella sp. NBU2979]
MTLKQTLKTPSDTTLTFSRIETTDLDAVMAIEQRIYPNPWTQKLMADCLAAGYQCHKGVLACAPEQVACYAFMMMGYEESNLLNLGVNPAFQRQSLASQMLTHLLLISRINHAKQMWLEVRESNQAAIKLYEKFAFKNIGQRKNYYRYTTADGVKVKEHAWLMSRPVVL